MRIKIRKEVERAIGGRLKDFVGPKGGVVKIPEVGVSDDLEVDYEGSKEVVARVNGVNEVDVVSCQGCEYTFFDFFLSMRIT